MGKIYGNNQGGTFSPLTQQKLNQADSDQNGLSLQEIKKITGEDLNLSQAEAQKQGIDENSRLAINDALKNAKSTSLAPNTLIFPQVQPTQSTQSTPESPTASPETDQETRRSLMKEPEVRTLGKDSRNFFDVINPVDSPGDNVEIRLEGEAGVRLWGPLGIEASGGAGIKVSMADDGLYYLSFDAQADVGIAASTQNAKIKAAGGGAVAKVYRFENKEQINQFLLEQFNKKLPPELRSQFLPQLERNTKTMGVRPITQTAFYGKIAGKVKMGKVELDASFEHRRTTSTYNTPSGKTVASDDYNNTTQVNLQLGERVKVSGTYTNFHIDKDPWIPENTGTYNKFEGNISLTFTKEEVAALSKGQKLGMTAGIGLQLSMMATDMGLTGAAADKFFTSVMDKAANNIQGADGSKKTSSRTIGIAFQAQWESDKDGGSGELQYFRLGSIVSVEKSASVDLGVAYGSLKGSASATDVTDIVVGNKDETYLAGLYFNNRKQYEIAKAKLGGAQAIVGKEDGLLPNGQRGDTRKTLAQWENHWQTQEGRNRTNSLVDEQISDFGKAQKLYDYTTKNFKKLDGDGDGFISAKELAAAKRKPEFASQESQSLISELSRKIETLEELSDNEWGDENDGITWADIKVFLENAKNSVPGN
jgi:hypothetical protein